LDRYGNGVSWCRTNRYHLGNDWTVLRVFRYLAVGYQYRHYHNYFFNGIPDPKHPKLDELIRATKGARTQYVGLEDLSDADLDELDKEFKLLTQNPGTLHAMKKLHEKIATEHARRRSLTSAGASVLHMFHRTPNDQAK
jgi:hypothetical protein